MRPGGVLVIGLDGGTLRIIGPLAERGVMPAFAELMRSGRAGPLRSTLPWYTVPGWASLMTGTNPARHGLLHWVVADPSDYFEHRRYGRRFVTSADIAFPTFWDVAGAAGKRVAVVNMPMTYPAWPVNGSMVTGLLTPRAASTGACHPPDLLDRFPGYQVDLSTSWQADSPDAEGEDVDLPLFLRELIHLTEGRGRLAGPLLAERDVDLGVVVFIGPDRISHKAWPEQERAAAGADGGEIEGLVEEYYRMLDRVVGELVAASGDGITTMVVSDHGFGPPSERLFGANAWLHRAGYLHANLPTVGARVASRAGPLRRLARPLHRRMKERRNRPGESALVDWSRSSAYSVLFAHARMFGVVLNRAGVKREGWVREEDAPGLVQKVRRELEALTDERGRKVVARTHAAGELGATAPGFPDVLVETADPFYPAPINFLSASLFRSHPTRSGLHERDGIFVVAGDRVTGRGAASADIVDVAPTVLGLLGIEAPPFVEGLVRRELVELPRLAPPPEGVRAPAGRQASVSQQEQEEIERHLQMLGYTE